MSKFKDGLVQNMLLSGSPGTGKTSCAKAIVNQFELPYLYINASTDTSVDVIRTRITDFCSTVSIMDKPGMFKVVILDEADGLTPQAQGALSNTMETYAKYCRFILTANYKHKIIPALQSRCQSLDLKPVIDQAVKRCYTILQEENVTISDEQKKAFVMLVKRYFPDLRKTINELQKSVICGELHINNTQSDEALLKTIFEKVTSNNTLELRKHLIENEDRFQGDYDTLMANFLDYLYEQPLNDMKKKEMIAVIADHLYKSTFVVDKEINCFACWINLEKVN